MYGRLGYYHYMASTQLRLAREAESLATEAGGHARPHVKAAEAGVHHAWIGAAAVLGAICLATAFAWAVGA